MGSEMCIRDSTDNDEQASILKLTDLEWHPARAIDESPAGYGEVNFSNDSTGLSSTSQWGKAMNSVDGSPLSGDSGNPIMMIL